LTIAVLVVFLIKLPTLLVLLLTRLILTRLALTGLISLLRLPGLSTALPLSALSRPTALLPLSGLATLFIHIICHENPPRQSASCPAPWNFY
jgi:hypothetical protein